MEHVVFHPGPDGAPAFRRCASLDDAVRYVEHLRNTEGVTEVSVHTLSAVPLSFRTYYRVEVPGEGPAPVDAEAVDLAAQMPVDLPAQAEPVLEAVPALEPAADPAAEVQFADVAPVAVEQPSNGKRSMGFFAH